ncbi:tetratricopeptide repeat protein [Paractinoplanes durhamensis]|uniref:tetratricopeptide repeat protein n=1 Tax=Paractinoplanes durhamensis TaxID=113563 RepID=UPI00364164DE
MLAVMLADRYGDEGKHQLAADVLNDSAHRWNEPGLMLESATHLRAAREPEAAIRAAERAITMGGPEWAGQFNTRALIYEIHVGNGQWDLAIEQARNLVTLDPNAADARWALVHALVRRNDREGAWNALTPDGDPFSPATGTTPSPGSAWSPGSTPAPSSCPADYPRWPVGRTTNS